MWSALAQKRKGSPQRASYAQNVRFSPGIVKSRPGLTVKSQNVTSGNAGLCNWAAPNGHTFLLYFTQMFNSGLSGGCICFADLSSLPDLVTIQAGVANLAALSSYNRALSGPTGQLLNTVELSCAESNNLLYITGYDPAGRGTIPCYVWDGGGRFRTAFFQPPAGTAIGSAAAAGPGYCSAGTHQFGVVYQDATGFLSRPLSLGSITLSSPSKIAFSVTLPGISFGEAYGNASLYLLMTRADNPAAWYFIPTDPSVGAVGEFTVSGDPARNGTVYNFVANVSDGDMAASLEPANTQWLVLAQDQSGAVPFYPSFVVPYGTRLCYGVGSSLYVSDRSDPQHLTGDQHVVTNPGQRPISYAFPLPGSPDLFLVGDNWTARTTDNGDVPATWAVPVMISDTLGAPFPNCVCFRTGGNYAWVVNSSGVYRFDGAYAERPITYLVSDQWARVNWSAAFAIKVVDDFANLRLYVLVPIDGAYSANAIFCIDYQEGTDYQQVDISLDVPASDPTGNALASFAIVREQAAGLLRPVAGQTALWFSQSNGPLLRFDENATADTFWANGPSQPIHSIWESGLVRGVADFTSRMIRVGALDVWARGSGNLVTTVYGPGGTQSVAPALLTNAGVPATLNPVPGTMYQEKFDLSKIENYTVRFETNGPADWFELSGFTAYAKPDLYNR
jgi:hypothetical protein